MGKKKKQVVESSNPAHLRYGERTIDELKVYSKQLDEMASEIDALALAAKKLGHPTLDMDGVTKMDRALVLAADFIAKVEDAITRAKRDARKEKFQS